MNLYAVAIEECYGMELTLVVSSVQCCHSVGIT